MINDRKLQNSEHNNLFNEFQLGFGRGRSTQHVTTMLQSTIEENNRQRKVTIIVTRDIQKAFDTAWHKDLIFEL